MNEIENAKPIVKLLEAVRGVMERDIGLGLYQHTTLKLTIEKRKEIATALINGGASQRQAAKALGVDQSTIRRDIGKLKPASKDAESVSIDANDDPGLPDQKMLRARYQRSLVADALAAVADMSKKARAEFFAQLKERYGYGVNS